MIVICPACATRYRVAEPEFADRSGRTVRCANCGHIWYETAAPRQKGALSEFAQPPLAASRNDPAAAPASIAEPEVPPRLAPVRRARSAVTGLGALALLLGGLVVAIVFAAHHWAPDRPSAPAPAAAMGEPTPPTGSGLIIRKITPARTGDGLIVDGEIANPGTVARDVPRLRVALEDSADKEVQFKTIDPPKPRLQPGEVMHFETPFTNPPDAATGVVVTFASS